MKLIYIVCATWNAVQCFALSSVSKAARLIKNKKSLKKNPSASSTHQTCIFIVDFGVENGNFSEIGLFWKSVACCRNMMLMLKKIVEIRESPVNEVR